MAMQRPPHDSGDEVRETHSSLEAAVRDVPSFLTPDQKLYMILASVFVSSLLIGDVIGGKFFVVGGVELSVGIIPFPVTYVLTDVVNEFYGKKGARFITFVSAGMAVYAFLLLQAALHLPVWEKSPVPQEAFASVFGFGVRLFVASLIAFLVSQLVDIYVFQFFKRITEARHIWLRSTGSTALSQIVDTFVINFILLVGSMSTGEILSIVFNSYLYKLAAAVLLTPAVYALHTLVIRVFRIHPEATVRRAEGI